MNWRSARVRLTLVNVLLIAVLISGLAVATFLWVRADLMASIDLELKSRSNRFLGLRVGGRIVQSQTEAENADEFIVPFVPYRPRIFAADGTSLTQMTAETRFPTGGKTFATVPYQDGTARVYSREIGNGRLLQYVYPLADSERALAGITRVLLFLGPIGVLLASLVGFAVTVRTLRPVELMAREASAIQSSTLQRRLPVEGADELSKLAQTFNDLLDRIEVGYRRLQENVQLQKRFTADASHELRTPLTAIRGRADLALESATTIEQYRSSMQVVARSAATMSSLIEDLLLLARSDAGHLKPAKESVEVRRVFEESTQGIADRQIELRCDAEKVVADPAQLLRVLSNLVGNAHRHSSEGGSITLSSYDGDGGVFLSVKDDGEGIPPDHLPHIFERFYRADASRGQASGSGLGLAICKEIVEAHGGRIEVDNLTGRGAAFTSFWPLP